jgi:hypothetical protein
MGRTRSRGLTLLEAIHAVTVVLVVAIVAMAAIARYERHARTTEAVTSVTAIARSAAAYYNASDEVRDKRHFPPSSTASVPPSLDMVRGIRYQSSAADWAWPPWRDIGFSIAGPQSYCYSFGAHGVGGGARASAEAHGDLDGDGRASTFMLSVGPDDKLDAVAATYVEKIDPED